MFTKWMSGCTQTFAPEIFKNLYLARDRFIINGYDRPITTYYT